jgi:hypothetical protein
MTELLDPTSELRPLPRRRADRLRSLEGQVVGLLNISKPRGDVFLDRLAALLIDRGVEVRRYAKPTHAKPAPAEVLAAVTAECQAVIEALAD